VASAAIPVSISNSATAAQWRTFVGPRSGAHVQGSALQQTGYARIGGRSLIGELTLHRVKAGPRMRASAKMAPGRQPS
jgi:hypothetical protein